MGLLRCHPVRSTAASKSRSRPLLDKQALSKAIRPPALPRPAIATRRRLPPRPRPTAASFFSLYEDSSPLAVIRRGRATANAEVQPEPSSSTVEDDICSSTILASLAEATNGRSLDVSYFRTSYKAFTASTLLDPEMPYGTAYTSPVAHAVSSAGDDADELPDFEPEPDSPEPVDASFPSGAGVDGAYSDANNEAGSDSEDAPLPADSSTNESVTEREAISFLDNVLQSLDPRVSPPDPTTNFFGGPHSIPLASADYQDGAPGAAAPMGIYPHMDLAMGDEEAVHSDALVVCPLIYVEPTLQASIGPDPHLLVGIIYQDADPAASAPWIAPFDTDLAVGDEARHIAPSVVSPSFQPPQSSAVAYQDAGPGGSAPWTAPFDTDLAVGDEDRHIALFVATSPPQSSAVAYQDADSDVPASWITPFDMDLAMGDEDPPFVAFPFVQKPPSPMAVYEDADPGAGSPQVMLLDMDLTVGDEDVTPFVISSPSIINPFDRIYEGEGECYMEDIESLPTASPSSLWTIRETVRIADCDDDLFGLLRPRFDELEPCQEDDVEVDEDSDLDLLTSRLLSLRLDSCTDNSAPQGPVECPPKISPRCIYCSMPATICLCLQLKAHSVPSHNPALLVPPYPRVVRTLWHPGWLLPMHVDDGLSLGDLSMLDLPVIGRDTVKRWRKPRKLRRG